MELISERFLFRRLSLIPPILGSHSLRANLRRTPRLFLKVQGSAKGIPQRFFPLLLPPPLLFLLRGKAPLPVPRRGWSLLGFPSPFLQSFLLQIRSDQWPWISLQILLTPEERKENVHHLLLSPFPPTPSFSFYLLLEW